MRPTVMGLLLFLAGEGFAAPPTLEGRWEGRIQIPGRETPAVLDLARDAAGTWTGSIILPSLDIKGAPLANIVATPSHVSFDLGNLLSTPAHGPARFHAHVDADGGLTGEFLQGGNVAKVSLGKAGRAEVDLPVRSTAVSRELEGRWIGEYEMGGYPRRVMLTLENHANAAATAKLVIVGKQVNDLPIDLVIEEDRILRVESKSTQVTFEGRFAGARNEISGTLALGAFELPLVLRRAERAS